MTKNLKTLIAQFKQKAVELADLGIQLHNTAVESGEVEHNKNSVEDMWDELRKESGMYETYMATIKIDV